MTDDRDPLIARVRETLRPLPAVRSTAVAEVLARVDAAATRDTASRFTRPWAMALLAAAAVVIGFVGRGLIDGSSPAASVAAAASATSATSATRESLSPASATVPTVAAVASSARVPVQFVYDNADARSVHLVGDFNGWGREAAPMSKVEGSSAWTVVLPLAPGRHLYAFVVNDTQWVADPRAPRSPDRDFGKPESVVMVEVR
jgi:hypothetical protein